jgi:DNA-binding GntR family transcriptional regulator
MAIESAVCINESTLSHGQRRQAIVHSLLRDVFQGRLRAGQHLVTRELADRFGVSHTPIREALISLAGIGVVDLLPNRGAVVRRLTARDIYEICQVRRALECEAVREACGRIDPGALEALAEELRRQMEADPSDPRFVDLARSTDNRLHDLIASSCGNAFLAAELTRLKFLFRACRDVAWEHDEAHNDLQRVSEEAREHLAVVEALLAGRRADAIRAMTRHINAGARYWSRAVVQPAETSLLVS